MEAIRSRKEMVVITFFWAVLVLVSVMATINGVKSLKSKRNPVLTQNVGNNAVVGGNNAAVGPMNTEGVVQSSEQDLIRYVEANPTEIDSMIRLGDIYYDRDEPVKAIEVFKKAEKVDPENLHVQTDLGMLYMKAKRPDEAIVKFMKVLELKPGFLNAHFYMGRMYRFDKNDDDKAVAHFEEVLNNNPNTTLRKAAAQQIAEIRNKSSL